jgi:hypothetical protein
LDQIFDWGFLTGDLGFSRTIKNPKSTIINHHSTPENACARAGSRRPERTTADDSAGADF